MAVIILGPRGVKRREGFFQDFKEFVQKMCLEENKQNT
jgi:hypothetical protein